jgi:DNA polymerase IV
LRVQSTVGITVSIGLSYAKFLAKMASDMNKPRGFSIIGKAEAIAVLAPRSVALLPGVGKAALARLEGIGIRSIGNLAETDPARLVALGKDGARLHRLAHGIDSRKVSPERETKSVSAETTLDDDLSHFDALEPILWRMSEKTSARMKAQSLAGRTVTLKLKTHDFHLITRARQLPEPTQLAARIFSTSRSLLMEACTGARFRLIGVGVSDLSDPSTADHGDLADHGIGKLKAVEGAVDALRAKFGNAAVTKGIGLGRQSTASPPRSAISHKPTQDES